MQQGFQEDAARGAVDAASPTLRRSAALRCAHRGRRRTHTPREPETTKKEILLLTDRRMAIHAIECVALIGEYNNTGVQETDAERERGRHTHGETPHNKNCATALALGGACGRAPAHALNKRPAKGKASNVIRI